MLKNLSNSPLEIVTTTGKAVARLTTTNDSGGSVLELKNNGSTTGTLGSINFLDSSATAVQGWINYFGGTDKVMSFGTNGTERMRILSNGNVGIGTMTPVSKLTVEGSVSASSSSGGASISGSNSSSGIGVAGHSETGTGVNGTSDGTGPTGIGVRGTNTNGVAMRGITQSGIGVEGRAEGSGVGVQALSFSGNIIEGRAGGSLRFILTNAGKVGIGTASPGTKLHVVGDDNDGSTATLKISTGTQNMLIDGNEIDALKDGLNLNHNTTQNVLLVNGGGNVGIGTTSPAEKLHVNGRIRVGQLAGSSATHLCINANVISSCSASDARLKTNLMPITNVLEKLNTIRGVSFEWNEAYKSIGGSSAGREIGVIAQEVEAAFPELVTQMDTGYKTVNYERLTAVLIEAVKELKADNEALRAELKSLMQVVRELKQVEHKARGEVGSASAVATPRP